MRRLFALLWLAIPACSVVLDTDRGQCASSSDCRSSPRDLIVCDNGLCVSSSSLLRGAKFDCARSFAPTFPARQRLAIRSFTQTGPTSQPSAGQPVAVDISLCRPSDRTCAAPVDGPRRPDADGNVELDILEPGLFALIVPVDADAAAYPRAKLYPADVFLQVGRADPSGTARLQFADRGITSALATLIDERVDPTKGQLITTVLPCPNADTLGLEFTTDLADPARRYYVSTTFPDFQSPTTVAGPTYPQSVGGFINVSTGTGAVKVRDPGRDVDVMWIDVDVDPDANTYVFFDLQARP